MEPVNGTLLSESRALVLRFNKVFESHKRPPLDMHERLSRGEQVVIYSGNEERWTARLIITVQNNTLAHTIDIDETLPPRMREQLEAKRRQFIGNN